MHSHANAAKQKKYLTHIISYTAQTIKKQLKVCIHEKGMAIL